MIELPSGLRIDEHDLAAYVIASGRDYIIQGQQNASFQNHTKPRSLDVWLRGFAENRDTKQADNSVTAALARTGLFEEADNLRCPDTLEPCKGLRLVGGLRVTIQSSKHRFLTYELGLLSLKAALSTRDRDWPIYRISKKLHQRSLAKSAFRAVLTEIETTYSNGDISEDAHTEFIVEVAAKLSAQLKDYLHGERLGSA